MKAYTFKPQRTPHGDMLPARPSVAPTPPPPPLHIEGFGEPAALPEAQPGKPIAETANSCLLGTAVPVLTGSAVMS